MVIFRIATYLWFIHCESTRILIWYDETPFGMFVIVQKLIHLYQNLVYFFSKKTTFQCAWQAIILNGSDWTCKGIQYPLLIFSISTVYLIYIWFLVIWLMHFIKIKLRTCDCFKIYCLSISWKNLFLINHGIKDWARLLSTNRFVVKKTKYQVSIMFRTSSTMQRSILKKGRLHI